ncbi:hypothetical protein BDZ45DRAFT_349964 [Acephala macrosclerotiorum]|nr:hypothetical protein BDZ45DRAFT_349964 [Acephala macrosclerotiorum]
METSERARRRHPKSRKGCIPCKKRHERCDEFLPRCHNCSKRGSRCEYPEFVRPKGESAVDVPSTISVSEIEMSCNKLEDASLAQRLSPYDLSSTDLPLMHHLLFVSGKLEASGTSKMAVWTAQIPNFISMSQSHDIVKHSILALSAAHLGWLTRSRDMDHVSLLHQTAAFRSLQVAINKFSRENCDAVLASSLILQWQASNWRTWSTLSKGSGAVMEAMRPWVNESMFSRILLQSLKDAEAEDANPIGPTPDDHARLNFCIVSLKKAEDFMTQTEELAALHKGLLSFTENLRNFPPGPKASQQYRIIYPLRGWLFWMPRSLMDMDKGDINTLVSFAYFSATSLAIKPFFPLARNVVFRQTQASAVKSILRFLKMKLSSEGENFGPEKARLRQAVTLVEYAVTIAGDCDFQEE